MRPWLCFDGSEHPVSDRFLAIADSALSGLPYSVVEGERQAWLASGTRIGPDGRPIFYPRTLTLPQQARLKALDYVINMNRALQFLDGRDYRSHNELFGPNGTLDQVHGIYWRPDTCGCQLTEIFDHWLRHWPKKIVKYPHHFNVIRCSRHAHLTDFRDHYYAVLEENQTKNRLLNTGRRADGN